MGLDVILQIGAHRTASTSFQTYMRLNAATFAQRSVAFWGPMRTRKGMFHGVIPRPELGQGQAAYTRAQGRIAMHLARTRQKGLQQLLVSDENILGTMGHNLATQSLYPDAAVRLAQFQNAFDVPLKAVHISIRDLSTYWASTLGFMVPRGRRVPGAARIAALCRQPRNWRDVICDLATALPDTQLIVSTFERHAARPDAIASYVTGVLAPRPAELIWRNQRPIPSALLQLPLSDTERARIQSQTRDGTWSPFHPEQLAHLRERYADDLFWLRSGADGLADLLEDPRPAKMGHPAPLGFAKKGQRYDREERLARPG